MWVILHDEDRKGWAKEHTERERSKESEGMLFGQKGLLHGTQQPRIPLRGMERRWRAGWMEE